PLTIQHIALAARDVPELSRIDEPHLEAARGEELEERNPIDARGFHRDGLDAASAQPLHERGEVRRERPEFPDIAALGGPPGPERGVGAPRADIDPGGVEVHVAQGWWQANTTGGMATSSWHTSSSSQKHSRPGRARRGDLGILPNGITPASRRSPMRSSHFSETTLRDGHHAPLGKRSSRPDLSPGDSTPDCGVPDSYFP